MINLDHYRAWLKTEGYRPTTCTAYTRSAQRILAAADQHQTLAPTRGLRYAAGRLTNYIDHQHAGHWPSAELHTVVTLLLEPPAVADSSPMAKKQRQRAAARAPKRSFNDDDWFRLVLAIADDKSPEARVLEVIAATGMRISDVTRQPKGRIRRGVQQHRGDVEVKGGGHLLIPFDQTTGAWERLLDAWKGATGAHDQALVAEWLCPDSPPESVLASANKRVARKLKALAAEVGVDGRAHLHRMRRTIAVQALRTTKDVGAVQQLLGHASIATTHQYVNEARPDDVAALQAEVARTFNPLAGTTRR